MAASTFTLYIPTLRSLRDLGNDNLFQTTTSRDYSINTDSIFTGQSLYNDVEAMLRGNWNDRENLRKFENWLGKTFFEGRMVVLMPKKGRTTLTVKIGTEEEKEIHELGDGIQTILTLAFPLFREQDKHLIAFIEEPELFLHPWLQRVYLEMLSNAFSRHQYFLTTHSNHFLDLTLDFEDVSVFTLEKEVDENHGGQEKPAKFTVRQVSRADRKPLELLGVRNSSVLLSNCTIWVEGITDRRYIAHWLKLHLEHLKAKAAEDDPPFEYREDLHYSFVEYGGSNITHFSFLDDPDEEDKPDKRINVDRLCAKLFLITDHDGDAKPARREKLEKMLRERYCCLPGREIENLIKPEVLQRVLKSYGEPEPPLFPHDSYLDEKLGEFLDGKLGESMRRKGGYNSEGTIKGKVRFCEKAIEATHSWEDLSEHAQQIAIRLRAFIGENNK